MHLPSPGPELGATRQKLAPSASRARPVDAPDTSWRTGQETPSLATTRSFSATVGHRCVWRKSPVPAPIPPGPAWDPSGRAETAASFREEGRSAMIPGQFDYVRPADLAETLRILKDREGEAKLLSGGYSLLPLLKLRLAQPAVLVDLRDVAGLDGITETDDEFRIGGRATHRRIHEDAGLAAALPLVHDAAGGIGDPQVRNWGTIGGSVRPRRPVVRLAGGAARASGLARLRSLGRRTGDRGPRVLPRHLHHGDRADRGPDRDPDPAAARAQRRRLRQARAPGRRLRDGRVGRPAHLRRRRPDLASRGRADGRGRDADRRDRCRGR